MDSTQTNLTQFFEVKKECYSCPYKQYHNLVPLYFNPRQHIYSLNMGPTCDSCPYNP